ncbi:NUDIX domain-containing protein, partial [bacterium]|nr:NUDIX domain-containing protein [bacterium]
MFIYLADMENKKEFVLSVYALIPNNMGQYLLLKRSKKQTHNPNEWDLPGGKIDGGETLHKALLREVAEETSLNRLSQKQ